VLDLQKNLQSMIKKRRNRPPPQGGSKALDESMQTSSVSAEKAEEIVSEGTTIGSDGQPLREPEGPYFPAGSHETDENAKKFLTKLSRDSKKRIENPPLLLDDLKGLGMYGELSEDQCHITMPFEDVHRLSTTMRMTEIILNERIQNKRKATKLELLKAQLNASNCKAFVVRAPQSTLFGLCAPRFPIGGPFAVPVVIGGSYSVSFLRPSIGPLFSRDARCLSLSCLCLGTWLWSWYLVVVLVLGSGRGSWLWSWFFVVVLVLGCGFGSLVVVLVLGCGAYIVVVLVLGKGLGS
jgi:hypothetical protein